MLVESLPAATWTESKERVMLRLHMCRLWTAVTPLTDSSSSLTELMWTSRGVPAGKNTKPTLGVTNAQPAVSEKDIFMTNTQCLPSISILKTSFVMGSVVPTTSTENRNVQIGSAILYSGCEENRNTVITNNRNKSRG